MITLLALLTIAVTMAQTPQPRGVGMRRSIFGKTFETDAGLYKIKKVIGQGSFAVAYLASSVAPFIGDDIVIKKIMLAPQPACLPGFSCTFVSKKIQIEDQTINPFNCEAMALKRLGRLAAEPILSPDGMEVYIPMNLTQGKAANVFLASKGSFAVRYISKIFFAAQAALSELHSNGIAHRDCHVDNFLILELNSGGVTVTWIDFGWAKLDPGIGVPAECQITFQNDVSIGAFKEYLMDQKQFRSQFYAKICLKYFPIGTTFAGCIN